MIDRFALVIGAMKAGTTTLVDHLAKHPEIAACSDKEPGYFAFDDVYAKGVDWYESLYNFNPLTHKIAIEGSTDYTKFPHCPHVSERIKSFGRDVRLIYLVRHPLRRIESHARHVQRSRRELGSINSERSNHSLEFGISPVSLDVSRYAMQLDQYREFFDSGRLLVRSLEEMVSHPSSLLKDVCEFLEIAYEPVAREIEPKNAKKAVAFKTDPHPLWKQLNAIAPLKSTYTNIVPESTRRNIRNFVWPKRRIEGRFALNETEQSRLLEQLAPDLRRLSAIYGFDVAAAWGIEV